MGVQYYFVNMAEKRVLSVGKQYWIAIALRELRKTGKSGNQAAVTAAELAAIPLPDYWTEDTEFRDALVAWLMVYGPTDFVSEHTWDEAPWMEGRYTVANRVPDGGFWPDPEWECFDAQPPPAAGWKAWPPV